MRLLEFQAKEVFSEYGISLLKGAVSTDIGKAREDAKTIGYPMVVKSQVPVGGRETSWHNWRQKWHKGVRC